MLQLGSVSRLPKSDKSWQRNRLSCNSSTSLSENSIRLSPMITPDNFALWLNYCCNSYCAVGFNLSCSHLRSEQILDDTIDSNCLHNKRSFLDHFLGFSWPIRDVLSIPFLRGHTGTSLCADYRSLLLWKGLCPSHSWKAATVSAQDIKKSLASSAMLQLLPEAGLSICSFVKYGNSFFFWTSCDSLMLLMVFADMGNLGCM